jgi:O-antigen ligase
MVIDLNKTLIWLTIFFIPAYLIRVDIFGMPTNILEILVLLTFIANLARGKCSLVEFYKNNKTISWSVMLIFIGLLTSTLFNNDWRTGFGIIKGWFVVPLIFSWVAYDSLKTVADLKSALKCLYLGIFGVAAISLVFYFSGNLTYDGRLAGIYNSPNFLAMYLSPAVFVGIYLIKSQISKLKTQSQNLKLKTNSMLLISSLILILTTLYLTYSYAAWAAVIGSLIIIHLIKNRKFNKQIILISLIIILLIAVTQWNTQKFDDLKNFSRSSLESRIMIWQAAVKILADNPVWGIGPGNFQNKYLEYQKYFPPYLEWAVPQPHNIYLAFWLQSGLLGLIGFLTLIAIWFRQQIALIKTQKNSEVVAVFLGIILYILIHGLIDTPYWKNDLALVFWLIIALSRIIFRQSDLQKIDNLQRKKEIS